MLSLICATAFLQQSTQSTIAIRYSRPSVIVDLLRQNAGGNGIVGDRVHVAANDPEKVVVLQGSVEDLVNVREIVKLLDVARPMLRVKMHIEAAGDRGYDVTTSVHSSKKWSMTDEDTGLAIGLIPRVNEKGEITLMVSMNYPGGSRDQKIRLKNGEKYTIDLGTNKSVAAWPGQDGSVDATNEVRTLPKVTFQVNR